LEFPVCRLLQLSLSHHLSGIHLSTTSRYLLQYWLYSFSQYILLFFWQWWHLEELEWLFTFAELISDCFHTIHQQQL
jgi:hypothetical protein